MPVSCSRSRARTETTRPLLSTPVRTRWSVLAWILKVSVRPGRSAAGDERRARRRVGRRAGQQHLLHVGERRGRRQQRRDGGRRQQAPHCERVCGISGSVAESGSSWTGCVGHVVEAGEVDVVVHDALVVVLVEAALVAVRALRRDLVERGGDLARLDRVGVRDRGEQHVHEVVGVHRELRRLDDRLALGVLHADRVGAVGRLVLRLEVDERARSDLGRQPAAGEGEPVDPLRMVGELLADERVGAGRRGVDRDLPADAAGWPRAPRRSSAAAPRRAARSLPSGARAGSAASGRSGPRAVSASARPPPGCSRRRAPMSAAPARP